MAATTTALSANTTGTAIYTLQKSAYNTPLSVSLTAYGSFGSGTISYSISYNNGTTLIPLKLQNGTTYSTATNDTIVFDGVGVLNNYGLPDTTNGIKIYAILTGATSPAITIVATDNV
jgi:hypothetical protein